MYLMSYIIVTIVHHHRAKDEAQTAWTMGRPSPSAKWRWSPLRESSLESLASNASGTQPPPSASAKHGVQRAPPSSR